MKNLSEFINEAFNESILSSTNSGAYAQGNRLKELLLDAGIDEERIIIKSTKKDPTPYAIVKSSIKGYANSYEEVKLENMNSADMKTLSDSYGIYFRTYSELLPVCLKIRNTNNLELDISKWNQAGKKTEGWRRYEQKIILIECKNASILALPSYWGTGKTADKIEIYGDTTLSTLPKNLGNTKICIENKNTMNLNLLKGLTFNELELSPKYFEPKNYKQGYFRETFYADYTGYKNFDDSTYALKKEFNAKLEPIVKNLKNVIISILGEQLVDYNKKTDTYYFKNQDYIY